MPPEPRVVCCGIRLEADRAWLAAFGIAHVEAAAPEDWVVRRELSRLVLTSPASEGSLRIVLDVRTGSFAHRITSCRRDDPVARAVGMARGPRTVLDAMAGLGRDALVLARLGCTVTAVERVGALAALAADAALACGVADRMRVVHGDALDTLRALRAAPAPEQPEVVYLDPMFEEEGRAQVKKEAQVLRLLGDDTVPSAGLLAAAREVARDRVVVKRHRDLEPLLPGPSHAIDAGSVRFDVYLRPGTR
ncbi:MAG: rRNA ((1516)-N(2))-methyltransferase RsmJ [Planctomycetota bacterium]